MQSKTVYNRLLRSAASLDPEHNGSFNAPDLFFFFEKQNYIKGGEGWGDYATREI